MVKKEDKTIIVTQLALMAQSIEGLRCDVTEIKQKLENHYVTKFEFTPVRSIVYGMVSLILIAVMGALIALVVNR